MNKELPKVYEPQEVEGRIYEIWEKSGCFAGHRAPYKKTVTIVMPPPNVTGQLHMGHAMDCTLQDILIRFKRMQGYAALWVPGKAAVFLPHLVDAAFHLLRFVDLGQFFLHNNTPCLCGAIKTAWA